MCAIVGACAQRRVEPILLEGLRRQEYRGYDSAGMATLYNKRLTRVRSVGKVGELAAQLAATPLSGTVGIAHTRWATHGGVSEANAHPQCSSERLAVVHNGIIENHVQLKTRLQAAGYEFCSETDTEVIAHLIDQYRDRSPDLATAVRQAAAELRGAYALAVLSLHDPDTLVAVRRGSPLVLGVGIEECFVASDVAALLPVTRRFVHLEEGDIAVLRPDGYMVQDASGAPVERAVREAEQSVAAAEKGGYRHYMLKEIHEQPAVLSETLGGRVTADAIMSGILGSAEPALLGQVDNIHIVACGTSHNAGLVARYWIEACAGMACNVELASEYRYRNPVVPDNCLFVTLSQSGETADTLAALRYAKQRNYLATLAICNVPESSLVRESDHVLMTRAGPEIGVASTKAFTTQLLVLLMLTGVLSRDAATRRTLARGMQEVSGSVADVLQLDDAIRTLAEQFVDKQHALFLGRGPMYPIAMEGALKLKETSYLHAEAYAAGELKHGPLALVDEEMPVIAVAPNNDWLEKVKANLREVHARGGRLVIFAEAGLDLQDEDGMTVIEMPHVADMLAPIIYTVPLQLLAYHIAVVKGTDVDQPRNLAKSVTVE